jgi:maltose alpha-D-glucosyltransferase/alpha-amylase
MLGYVSFPPINETPYALTLAPYSFLWLELQPPRMEPEPLPMPEFVSVEDGAVNQPGARDFFAKGWPSLVAGPGKALLEGDLSSWLPRQRWFGAKSRKIQSVRLRDWVELPMNPETNPTVQGGANLAADGNFAPALFFVEVEYADGQADLYQLPLAFSTGADADKVSTSHRESILGAFTTSIGSGMLHDAVAREDFRQSLLALIERNSTLAMSTIHTAEADFVPADVVAPLAQPPTGSPLDDAGAPLPQPAPGGLVAPVPISAQPGEAATPPRSEEPVAHSASSQQLRPRESPLSGDAAARAGRLDARASKALAESGLLQLQPSRVSSAEQSNTSIVYGARMILKLFRRLQPGENPDVEIGRFLTEVASFPRIAPFLGEIAVTSVSGEKTTVAMLQGLVANQGDGWQWFLEQIAGFFASVADLPAPPEAPGPSFLNDRKPLREALEHASPSLEAAALLGRRTAEMHLALAIPTSDPAFAAEPFTAEDLDRDAHRINAQIASTLEALKIKISTLKDQVADDAALLLSRRIQLFARASSIAAQTAGGQRIRIHGDFHLGQTLRTGNAFQEPGTDSGDFVLLDFEGEPARPLAERREKQSPLKDVAGMIRSLSYAAYSGLDQFHAANPEFARGRSEKVTAWAVLWQNSTSSQFLRAYREAIAANPALLPSAPQCQALLGAYLLEKALYELLYELNNRPTWLRIPLAGILAL